MFSVRGGPWRTAYTPALGRGWIAEVAMSPTQNTLPRLPCTVRFSPMATKPDASAGIKRTLEVTMLSASSLQEGL